MLDISRPFHFPSVISRVGNTTYLQTLHDFLLRIHRSNESVEKALFWLFSDALAFEFIASKFTKNDFFYRLND
jgi:hypothetical protein